MNIRENESLKGKTTMRIGGTARYYAELRMREEVDQAFAFAQTKNVPLIVLGTGANMIFAEGEINALVVRIGASDVKIDGTTVTVSGGKNLAMLINDLANEGLDLSPLTGIPGTIGGAIFGNAGQGKNGIWIDTYVRRVDACISGEWRTLHSADCCFGYRTSRFKEMEQPIIIWSAVLDIPQREPDAIKEDIESLLKRRIETQPHVKTAGSCFKSLADGTPAWQLIDHAGFRGFASGGIQISPKHANFLINTGEGTYADACNIVRTLQANINTPLEVEMRFVKEDGSLEF